MYFSPYNMEFLEIGEKYFFIFISIKNLIKKYFFFY